METCPLCFARAASSFARLDAEHYFQCGSCRLIFLDASHWPSPAQEKAQYDLHENDPDDEGYRQFLSAVSRPLIARLPEQASGLDYGCGPGPALVSMMREAGFHCDGYDPIYADHQSLLARQYDFVTCTEVAEHFHRPGEEFSRLVSMLRPGAWLAVMTAWYPAADQFAHWHYRLDPTHVCFYCPATFDWLAGHFGLTLSLAADNVVLMQMPPASRH